MSEIPTKSKDPSYESSQSLAGRGERLIAVIIDALILGIILLPITIVLRAYPKTPAALSVVYAKENCSMAR